jgi:hypothetical protein
MSFVLREVVHFLRVAPTAWRLQHRMSFLDCYDLIERDLDEVGKRQFRGELIADLVQCSSLDSYLGCGSIG